MNGQRETLGRVHTSSDVRENAPGVAFTLLACAGLATAVLWVLFEIEQHTAPAPPPEPQFIEVGPRPARPAPSPQPPDHPRVR